MKKIFFAILSTLILIPVCGTVSAKPINPVASIYTSEQRTCINNKQRDEIKPALDIYNSAIKDAITTRENAIKEAQKLTDEKAKTSAIKAANDTFTNDNSVKQARVPFMATAKSARENAIKECIGVSNQTQTSDNQVSFFQSIQNAFSKSTAALTNAFAIKKSTKTNVTTTTNITYTADQQVCINAKQKDAIKSATDALNKATKNQLATKQTAMKTALSVLNTATKDQLKTKQDAIKVAQKLTDANAKTAAIKAANDAYNNDSVVKQAKVPYLAAVKAANDAYNNDNVVKQAKIPYLAAVKAARSSAISACVGTQALAPQSGSFGQFLGSLISGLFGKNKH